MKDLTFKEVQKLHNDILREVVRVCDDEGIEYYAAYGTALGAVRHKGIIPWDGDADIYIAESDLDKFVSTMKEKLDNKFWLDYREKGYPPRDFPRVGLRGYSTGALHVDVFRLAGAPSDLVAQKRYRWLTGKLHKLVDVKQKGLKSYIDKKYKVLPAIVVSISTFFIPLSLLVRVSDWLSNIYPYDKAEFVGNSVSYSYKSIFPKRLLDGGVLVPYEDFFVRIPKHYDEYLKLMYGDYIKYPPAEIREKAMARIYHTTTDRRTGLITIYHYE